ANNTAVELALAHPATPRDPYIQPATAQDTPSRLPAPWQRDAVSAAWSRTVTDAVLEHGLKRTHGETATPSRAAALDAAAHATLAANLAHSRRGIAAHYQAIYAQRDWQQLGPLPGAVTDALHAPTNTLGASDGHTYIRDTQGRWSTPGRLWGRNLAEGNLRAELDATAQLIATTFAATHTAPATTSPAQVDAPPIPPHLRDFRHPGHPRHADYATLLQHVHAMEDRVRMPHGEHSERAAAALLDRHSADRLGPAARVELHGEGRATAMHLVTNERAAGNAWLTVERRTPVSVFDAVARSVDEASGDWSRRELPHLYQPQSMVEAPPRDPSTLDPCDLRRADHPRHGAFTGMRERIGAAYAQYGIARRGDQLDRATAAVMRDLPTYARLPDQVQLLPDPQTGRIGPDSAVLTRDSQSFLACTTTTHAAAMQQATETTFRQLDQLTMQQQLQPTQVAQAQPAQAMGR
ncbi:XVIPCD domain-containing protein, partial [Rhodanobacter lindaniclasticus]